ncbi:CDGSH iron-sulfur domain-containing protein [Jatrophihabitans endophyticus]|uniref:CDGSH iron-sulfur domain-containing protein n=1 Tax=Jatrophihabitans endophyticus TaxID=1206085 RepID=UPI001F331716|nr:CDGSH iron-sulfur domain-containing protein [Jatrophihabitans endophyticus]
MTVYPDGPLVVRGDFAVADVDGTPVETGRVVALCRCGRSALKPLCDGSHKRARNPRRCDG